MGIKGRGGKKVRLVPNLKLRVHNSFHTSEELPWEVQRERILPRPFESLRRRLLLPGALLDVLLLSLGSHLLPLLRSQLLLQQNEARQRVPAAEVFAGILRQHPLDARAPHIWTRCGEVVLDPTQDHPIIIALIPKVQFLRLLYPPFPFLVHLQASKMIALKIITQGPDVDGPLSILRPWCARVH